MIRVIVHYQKAGQSLRLPIGKLWGLIESEYRTSPEIQESFPTIHDYAQSLIDLVEPVDRCEVYLMVGSTVVGMLVTFSYTDCHYGKATAAMVCNVYPSYRHATRKIIVKVLREVSEDAGSQVYIRTTKLNPYVTRQVARRI